MTDSQWADKPYALLPTPGKKLDIAEHAAYHIANEMATVHNCMIRGLNAIYLQAPHISSASDIKDFQFFIYAWASWVQDHHELEDELMFPLFEQAADQPGLLQQSCEQHQEFVSGIHKLLELSKEETSEYSADRIRQLIDDFAPAMQHHLADEIDALLQLKVYDSEKLMEAYLKSEERIHGVSDDVKARVFPLAFGLRDVTYEGGSSWPNLPPEAIAGVISNVAPIHSRAWSFLPCDFYGQPRRLHGSEA